MYTSLPSFLIAFHGCDKKIKENILLGKDTLRASSNEYDWLGHGIYFWENDPDRALTYAKLIKEHPERCNYKISNPDVIGAVIDLKYCLNLFEEKALGYLRQSYEILENTLKEAGTPLPENKSIDIEGDVLIRKLDCAVFESLHAYRKETNIKGYDSIRSPFLEGNKLYPNSGFKEKNHIQICIINPNCIKGYFNPLTPSSEWPI